MFSSSVILQYFLSWFLVWLQLMRSLYISSSPCYVWFWSPRLFALMDSIPGKLDKPIPVCFTKVIKAKHLSRIRPLSNNNIDDNSELTLGLKYLWFHPLYFMSSLYKPCYLVIVQFVSLKIYHLPLYPCILLLIYIVHYPMSGHIHMITSYVLL